MAFSYVGPAVLWFVQAGGAHAEAAVSVTLGEVMPGLYELTFPHALPAALGATAVRVTLPDGERLTGTVGYLATSSLTFRLTERKAAP